MKKFFLILIFGVFIQVVFANNMELYFDDSLTYGESIRNLNESIYDEYFESRKVYNQDYSDLNKLLVYLKYLDKDYFEVFLNKTFEERYYNIFLTKGNLDILTLDNNLKYNINVSTLKEGNILIESFDGGNIIFNENKLYLKKDLNDFNINQINYNLDDVEIYSIRNLLGDLDFYYHDENLGRIKIKKENFDKCQDYRLKIKNRYNVELKNYFQYIDKSYLISAETFKKDIYEIADKYNMDRNFFYVNYMEDFGLDFFKESNFIYDSNLEIDLNSMNLGDKYIFYLELMNTYNLFSLGFDFEELGYYFFTDNEYLISQKSFINLYGILLKEDIHYIQFGENSYFGDLNQDEEFFVYFLAKNFNKIQVRKMLNQENFCFNDKNLKSQVCYEPLTSLEAFKSFKKKFEEGNLKLFENKGFNNLLSNYNSFRGNLDEIIICS